MNSAVRPSHKPLSLIIGLVGPQGSGRGDVARLLKRSHGFAVAALEQPLRDAVGPLFGASAWDLLFAADQPLSKVGKSPAQLIAATRTHVEGIAGIDFLTSRLVERSVARGEWHNQDLAITDLKTAEEIRWLRMLGGTPLWIRRDTPFDSDGIDPVTRLALTEWQIGDLSIVNDASLEALAFKVSSLISRARQVAAIAP